MNLDARPRKALYSEALDAAIRHATEIRNYMSRKRDFCYMDRDRKRDAPLPTFDAELSDLADHLHYDLKRMEENK